MNFKDYLNNEQITETILTEEELKLLEGKEAFNELLYTVGELKIKERKNYLETYYNKAVKQATKDYIKFLGKEFAGISFKPKKSSLGYDIIGSVGKYSDIGHTSIYTFGGNGISVFGSSSGMFMARGLDTEKLTNKFFKEYPEYSVDLLMNKLYTMKKAIRKETRASSGASWT